MVDNDRMEIGDVIPLEGGWFMDKDTNVVFRLDEDGSVVTKNGTVLMPSQEHDAQEVEE